MNQLNNAVRMNRAQIEWLGIFSTFEYVLVDYLMFRSWPMERLGRTFKFHVNVISRETRISKGKISKLLNSFSFVSKVGIGQKSHFVFNYNECNRHCLTELKRLRQRDKTMPSEGSSAVFNASSDVHIANEPVHSGNITVHTTAPISSTEVGEEVCKGINKEPLLKDSEEYKRILKEIDDAKTFFKVSDMQILIENNEQILRHHRDYDLLMIHLVQCKNTKRDMEKRRNCVFNRNGI